jgi:hypothetical protein
MCRAKKPFSLIRAVILAASSRLFDDNTRGLFGKVWVSSLDRDESAVSIEW